GQKRSTSPMSLELTINKCLAVALLVCGLFPAVALAHIPIPPKQPSELGRRVVKTAVADFKLIDQNDKSFQFSSKRGKLVLATFIFTTCIDVCPLFTAKFATIQRALDAKKFTDYWLLSITTDPEQDSAAALKDYAARFKADFAHWSFLTGTRADLTAAWKAFGVNVTKTEAGQVFHTALTTLIDRRGNRRIDYYGEKWLDKEVLKDIQWLSSQK
ncbi:MAG: SCO family protein, partial [Candidatus Binatia bacterium]